MEQKISINEIPVAAIVINKSYNIVYANKQCEQLLLYNKEELSNNLNISKLVDANSIALLEKYFTTLITEKNDLTVVLKCKNGVPINAKINSSPIKENNEDLFLLIITDISENKELEQKLHDKEHFFRKVIDAYPDFIFAKNWNGEFTLANQAVADIYNTTIDDILGKKDADFNNRSEEVARFLEDDREVMRSLKSKLILNETVTNPVTKKSQWHQTIKIPLLKGKLDDRQVLGLSTDVTDLWMASQEIKKLNTELEERIKQRTEKLELANKQVNILFKEMNHRVKNNLQIISSLLNIQSSHFENEDFKTVLQNSREQIGTISLIHDILYKNNSLSSMNIENYLTSLIKGRINNSLFRESVTYQITINSPIIEFIIDTITPLGLLINELATNSLKHAFTEKKNGKIAVSLNHLEDNRYEIIYSDNGIGFSQEKITSPEKHNLGLELIEAFTSQLDGTSTFSSSENGVEYKFSIRLK